MLNIVVDTCVCHSLERLIKEVGFRPMECWIEEAGFQARGRLHSLQVRELLGIISRGVKL
jgi:hypothetical protein